MKVQKKAYVAIDYTLTIDSGEVVDRSESGKPLGFVYGSGQIIPGLERQIDGMELNREAKIVVEAAEGYGEVQKELMQELPRKNFPADVKIEAGMTFQAMTPHGPMKFNVASANDDVVVADLNHPLAGKRLTFDLKIAEVREATEEELNPPQHHDGCDGSHSCGSCGNH